MKYLLFLVGYRKSALTFSEALILLKQGKRVRQANQAIWYELITQGQNGVSYSYIAENNGIYSVPTNISINSILANDWELV